MKKHHFVKVILIFLLSTFMYAGEYCQKCGMSLHHHEETQHKVIIDGKEIEVCSLHCAIDAIKDNNKYDIKAFDNSTKSFMPIADLIYVIGSSKKGAMTKESEFAFSNKNDADTFMKENGGKIIDGKEIIKYAESKWNKDREMIESNQSKMMALGKNIANEYCNNTKNIKANNIADFKVELKKYCKNIDEKGLQAVALYLWNNR